MPLGVRRLAISVMTQSRTWLRRRISEILYFKNRHQLSRASSNSSVILTYHRVLPEHVALRDRVQPGMYVTPETLDLHIRAAKQIFRIQSLSAWVGHRSTGCRSQRPTCIFTFDDGWADNFRYALPVLKLHGVRATVFLATSLIGTQRRLWQDVLFDILTSSTSGLPEQVWYHIDCAAIRGLPAAHGYRRAPSVESATRLIVELSAHSDDIATALVRRLSEHPMLAQDWWVARPEHRFMTWQEVTQWRASGMEVGSHTASHARLGALGTEMVIREVDGALASLHENGLGDATELAFCYPNGAWSPAADGIVRDRHVAAVLTTSGANDFSTDVFRLKRIRLQQSSSASLPEFFRRIASCM